MRRMAMWRLGKRSAWVLVGNVEGYSSFGITMRQRQEFNGS
jgi:hypothetical protein